MPTPLSASAFSDQGAKHSTLVIDVRNPEERSRAYIAGSVHLPLPTLSTNPLEMLQVDTVLIYCQNDPRSIQATQTLQEKYPDISFAYLKGGIQAWENAGFPLASLSHNGVLPLMRQVQLTVGLLLLLFCSLGFQVHPAFFYGTAFLGLGLTNAGLTGWCGLAKLLNRMPWNKKRT